MKKKLVLKGLYWLICAALLMGCTAPASVSETVMPTAVSVVMDPTDTLVPVPTNTPAPTQTPSLVPTATLTLTPEPTATPTLTPTPVSPYLARGKYQSSSCVPFSNSMITMNYCVDDIEVNWDYSVTVTVSWDIRNNYFITMKKKTYEQDLKVSIRDNFGKSYDFIKAGGDAVGEFTFTRYERRTLVSWYTFPPISKDVTSLSFHDENNRMAVLNIPLTNLRVIYEAMNLVHSPNYLVYKIETWEQQKNADGSIVLQNKDIPGCKLYEWQADQTTGSMKNALTLGGVDYEIYGWIDQEKNIGMREYLVTKGAEKNNPDQKIIFRLEIPLDSVNQCVLDATNVFSLLYTQK